MRRLSLTLLLSLTFLSAGPPLRAQVDPDLLSGMKARSIGPAGMSGRIAAIEGVESNPNLIYVGAASGGLWKSTNAGLTWTPIFDDQPVHAIGAIAVFQPNPDIVWVGTGEGNVRNSVSVGNGLYKSLDAGQTWTHLGLDETERIYRILLHPTDPEVAYVCALGKLWGENPERGVFKTEDGGQSWEKILYRDEKTGCADLALDPSNPQKLIAALWQHRRWPWFFQSGGPGSGLHMTVDGGRSWKNLTESPAFPEGELGRIGVAFSRSQPEVVYALVEAEKSALLRSDDGGATWRRVNEDTTIAPRPFYYADLRVDPERPNRLYSLHSRVTVSDDGGKSFTTLIPFRKLHPDHHAMWINPRDARHLLVGNDGGVGISHDRGQTWRFVSNLPLAQYYHINVDNATPYHVLGGMQDNGSWRGPAYVWENGGIRNHHWEEVGFGDGFDVIADPEDPLIGYAMSQRGFLSRWNLRTGERKDIRPAGPDDVELRFNWNAGLAIDPFDPRTIYYGSQFVHKSTDRGDTWTLISPDLTTNNPQWQKQKQSGGLTLDVTGAENFTSILTIAPSPVQRGVLWVGTDDGRIHLTRNGGRSWTSVEKNVPEVPANTWVPHIEASKFDAATAFVVFDDHRRSNWTPYVFRTTDYGRTWTSLATDELRGYALALEQDPEKEDLLFLGTEFGLYLTLDAGLHWLHWTHGFPTASAMDLTIHPREHDLIIGTHGRAAYVLDDIRPLRALSESVLNEPIHLFTLPAAQQYRVKQTGASRFPGQGEFRGTNRPYGALITYSLNFDDLPHPKDKKKRKTEAAADNDNVNEENGKKPKEPEVEIEITDSEGHAIRTFKQRAVRGVNRAVWNLQRDPFKSPREAGPSFFTPRWMEVLPGSYGVKVKYKEQEARGQLRVLADPRYDISLEVRQAKWAAIERAGRLQERIAEAVKRIRSAREDIALVTKKVRAQSKDEDEEGDGSAKGLLKSARELKKALKDMERRLWVPPDTKGIVGDTDVLSKISFLLRALSSSWEAPTDAQLTYLRRAEILAEEVFGEFNRLFREQVAAFRSQVQEAGIELLPPREPLALSQE